MYGKHLEGQNPAQKQLKLKETNFMPILLEYHGSYIMYALGPADQANA